MVKMPTLYVSLKLKGKRWGTRAGTRPSAFSPADLLTDLDTRLFLGLP